MRFFDDNCNSETFRHAPHKWFGACLISPLHAGELHYKKKYHLRYGHAKKLFVFDMLLLLATAAIAGTAMFWYLYDPSITSQVYLDIAVSPTRLKSGESMEITAKYKNNSSEHLLGATLRIRLPDGFAIENTTSTGADYDEIAKSYGLPTLAPGDEGNILIRAQAIAVPEKEEQLIAEISYTPEKTGNIEVKTVHYGFTARGSVLEGSIVAPDRVVESATFRVSIALKNTGEATLREVRVPLVAGGIDKFEFASSSVGMVKDSEWIVDSIRPHETVWLEGNMNISSGERAGDFSIRFTPSIAVGGRQIAQNSFERKILVIHPSMGVESMWISPGTRPGDVAELKVTVTNNGDTNLANLLVSMPVVKGIIDGQKMVILNRGIIKNGYWTLDYTGNPLLTSIAIGQPRDILLKIPILSNAGDATDTRISVPVMVGGFSDVDTGEKITRETITPKLKIGTRLLASAETRYYTDDGDQLGRGPLPPVVGKETKFWIFVTLENTTSRIDGLSFSARIPAGISWTGKTSVSQGQNVSYDATTRKVSWKTQMLQPHSSAGIYMEVAYTPGATDVGRIPTVLEHIRISGVDSFVEMPIERSLDNLKADFGNDARALEQGILTE